MKKDMSKHRDVSVDLNYKIDNIYTTLDHHIKIKQVCDSRDVLGGDSRIASRVLVTKRDAQNQTCNDSYVRMTIKTIIKDKITEMQAIDAGQLQSKLTRMEEENFNLRNRAIVLEERISFLEKKERDTLVDPLSREDGGVATADFPKKENISTSSLTKQTPITTQPSKSVAQSDITLASTSEAVNATSISTYTLTRPSNNADVSSNGALLSTTELPGEDRDRVTDEIPSVTTALVKTEVPSSPTVGNTTSWDTIPTSTLEITTSMPDLPNLTREATSEYRNLPKMSNPPLLSTNGTTRPRNKEIPTPRREVAISLDTPVIYRDSKNSSNLSSEQILRTGDGTISSTGVPSFYKPNHYERREHHDARNSKVRMYEDQLLGEISPNTHRKSMESLGSGDNNDFMREQDTIIDFAREMEKPRIHPHNYNVDERHSYFSPFKSTPHLPRSNSDSSISSHRNEREYNYRNTSQNTVNANNAIRFAESQRTSHEFRHTISSSSSEKKIETIRNPYMSNVAESSYSFSTLDGMYDPVNMELQGYDTNTKAFKLSLKRPAKLSTYSGARTDSRSMEYEPLSKVSPSPPPLIPSPNLNPSPNRYPVRHINNMRPPLVRPNYPISRPDYPSPTPSYPSPTPNYSSTTPNYPSPTPNYSNATTANYNIYATNFHAISRTAENYPVPNPKASSSYQDSYEDRIALPQLIAHITSDKSSIIFTWDKINQSRMFVENVDVYFLFAFHTLDLNHPPPKELSYWKRISVVNPLPLPIACTLTQSFDGQNYFFAVAAVNGAGRVGKLSNPCALKVAL